MNLEILRITTMRNEHDRNLVLMALRALPGVQQTKANLADHTVHITHDDTLSLTRILHTLAETGYTAAVLV